jgi:hypothetical protein
MNSRLSTFIITRNRFFCSGVTGVEKLRRQKVVSLCLAQIRGFNLNLINFIISVWRLPELALQRALLIRDSDVMGLCEGCAVLFHGLDGPLCMKCVKLTAAHSSTEREMINVSSVLLLPESLLNRNTEAAAVRKVLCRISLHEK